MMTDIYRALHILGGNGTIAIAVKVKASLAIDIIESVVGGCDEPV